MVKLGDRTDDLTTFLTVQIFRLTNQFRPLIDQVLIHTSQEQEPAEEKSPVEETNAARRSGINIQTSVFNQSDRVQAVFDHVWQTEPLSDSTLLRDEEYVSVEREIEIKLGQAGIEAPVFNALIGVINKQRNQLAHPEDMDSISYSRGQNRLEAPKGWIMVVDSYNEGNIKNPDLPRRALVTLLKYGLLFPRLISSSSGFEPSITVTNDSSTESSQQAFKLRPNSLDVFGTLNRSPFQRAATPQRALLPKQSLGTNLSSGLRRRMTSWHVLHSIEVADSTTGIFESMNICYALIGRFMKQ